MMANFLQKGDHSFEIYDRANELKPLRKIQNVRSCTSLFSKIVTNRRHRLGDDIGCQSCPSPTYSEHHWLLNSDLHGTYSKIGAEKMLTQSAAPRPQLSSLPLVEDEGYIKPTYQPSLQKTRANYNACAAVQVRSTAAKASVAI